MALAKADPLAPGVYWIDLFPNGPRGDGEKIFDKWAADSAHAVKVLRKERGAEANVRLFTVFAVAQGAPPPFAFPRNLLGSPTVQKLASAPGGVTQADLDVKSDQTVRKPEPAGLSDEVSSFFENLDPRFVLVAIAAVIFLTQKNR
jgi:hypothetical protein